MIDFFFAFFQTPEWFHNLKVLKDAINDLIIHNLNFRFLTNLGALVASLH